MTHATLVGNTLGWNNCNCPLINTFVRKVDPKTGQACFHVPASHHVRKRSGSVSFTPSSLWSRTTTYFRRTVTPAAARHATRGGKLMPHVKADRGPECVGWCRVFRVSFQISSLLICSASFLLLAPSDKIKQLKNHKWCTYLRLIYWIFSGVGWA